jgi:hypothetical protein
MYSVIAGRPWLLAAMTPLAASIYPPVSLIMGFALTVLLLLPTKSGGLSEDSTTKGRLAILAFGGLSTVMVLTAELASRSRFGRILDATDPGDLAAFPELLARHTLALPSRSVNWLGVLSQPLSYAAEALGHAWHLISTKSLLGQMILAGVLAGITLVIWTKRDNTHQLRLFVMPIVGLSLALLAVALYPRLYYPSRYLQSVVPLFFVVGFPVALALSTSGPGRDKRVVLGSLVFLLIFGIRGPDKQAGFYEAREEPLRPVFAQLETLPKGALIAAWPDGIANDIPLLSRRSVLVNYEKHTVRHVDWALQMRARVNALIDAYFAVSPEPLLHLNRDFGVTHLLVQRKHFEPNGTPSYIPPFRDRIRRLLKSTSGHPKLVENLMDSHYARQLSPDFSLIDLDAWTKKAGE